jgi:flagellar biosynthesis protein FliR
LPDLASWIDLELPRDAIARAVFAVLIDQFHVFTLVLVRVSGLMTVGPLFGQSVVPANVRVLLVLVVAMLVTPTLHDHWQVGLERLDANGSGRLEREEVPTHLLPRYDTLLRERQRDPRVGLSRDEFLLEVRFPRTTLEYTRVAVGEFALGLVLGLGVFIVLSGLSLAGQLLDQQSGLALGEIVNPGLDTEGSITGQFLFLLGMTVYLMEPFDGHLRMITALVETFQLLPAGEAFVSEGAIRTLSGLVQGSLVLAIRVAAPALAVMSLVALIMGFLGHTVPQINVLVVGFPIRAMAGLVILGLSLTGAAELTLDAIGEALDSLTAALVETSPPP